MRLLGAPARYPRRRLGRGHSDAVDRQPADNGTHGAELWRSDGTAAGTVLVKDINPGAAGSLPFSLTHVNGTLFFTADDGVHGIAPWKSDGTEAGTVLVTDLGLFDPGVEVVGGTLFIVATDGIHGVELRRTVPFSLSRLSLSLSLNQTAFHSGDRLLASPAVANSGPQEFLDVFLGALLPPAVGPALGCPAGDPIAFVTDAFARLALTCLSASPATFPPLFRGVEIPAGLPLTSFPNFFVFDWPPGDPAGGYTLFLALTPADVLRDGVIDPGDVLVAGQDFTFAP